MNNNNFKNNHLDLSVNQVRELINIEDLEYFKGQVENDIAAFNISIEFYQENDNAVKVRAVKKALMANEYLYSVICKRIKHLNTSSAKEIFESRLKKAAEKYKKQRIQTIKMERESKYWKTKLSELTDISVFYDDFDKYQSNVVNELKTADLKKL